MSVIKWRDSFNTGVEKFDLEHHKIVDLIDEMFSAIRDNVGDEVAEKACAELVAYTSYHFSNEEEAMETAGYPEIEEHKALHAHLKKDVEGYMTRIRAKDPQAISDFYHFLRGWLIQHIQDCDRKYGPFLVEK